MIISDFHTALLPLLGDMPVEQIFILTDENAEAKSVPIVLQQCPLLQSAKRLILPKGEENKSMKSAEIAWSFLLDHHATRQAIIINIGGGVLTDLGGWVAATYMRGIRFINIPTTLLSMIDASTGGKTGCNFGGYKNILGVFASPLATLIYPPFLATLPSAEWLSGYAEMLKHGLVADKKHWKDLLAWDIQSNDHNSFSTLIADSVAIKERVVNADPTEKDLRQVLNFGHTIGHAIEAAYIQQGLHPYHGHCVLWGMVAALYLSVVHAGCPREPLTTLTHIMIEYYGKPQCNCSQHDFLMQSMLHDKKNSATSSNAAPQVQFVLLQDIGQPLIRQTLSSQAIDEALEYLFTL